MFTWLRRLTEATPRVCVCGEPLHTRVVGVGQRMGAEPANVVSHWHCRRCGDVPENGSRT